MAGKAKKRKCKAKTKAGKPCSRPPVIGETHCLAHMSRKEREARGFGGPQPDSGRPKKPRVTDVMRKKIEAEIDKVLKPYFEALEGAVVHAVYEGRVIPSEHPDLAARIAAAEKLLDRVYGKPGQALELTGKDGSPIEIDALAFTDPKVRKAADEFARRVGDARADGARGSRSRD